MSDTLIGRVHVQDRDDWDVPDKVFYWDTNEHVRFRLNEDSGMITMRKGTPDGRYLLRFKVYDRRHTRTEVWHDFVRSVVLTIMLVSVVSIYKQIACIMLTSVKRIPSYSLSKLRYFRIFR